MAERGLSLDYSTIARWVLVYAPVLKGRVRRKLRRPGRFSGLMKPTSAWPDDGRTYTMPLIR